MVFGGGGGVDGAGDGMLLDDGCGTERCAAGPEGGVVAHPVRVPGRAVSVTVFVDRDGERWVGREDWPLWPGSDPAGWVAVETRSLSGRRYRLAVDECGARCGRSLMMVNRFFGYPEPVSCMMRAGHPGPHVPQDVRHAERVGVFVADEIAEMP